MRHLRHVHDLVSHLRFNGPGIIARRPNDFVALQQKLQNYILGARPNDGRTQKQKPFKLPNDILGLIRSSHWLINKEVPTISHLYPGISSS